MRISDFLYPSSIMRCQHIKINGVQCGSPALKNRKLCYFHDQWRRNSNSTASRSSRSGLPIDLPVLEDANSIQVALMQVIRLLLTHQIDHKTAALLFYALQTASSNLKRTKFEPPQEQVVIDPSGVRDTNLGDDAWYKDEFPADEVEEDDENAEDEEDQAEGSADEESDPDEDEDADDTDADEIPETINLKAMAEEYPASRRIRRAERHGNPRGYLGNLLLWPVPDKIAAFV